MLSYMVPSIEEKPPPGPAKGHLQLDLEAGGGGGEKPQPEAKPTTVHPGLTNGHPRRTIIKTQSKTSTISAESSASSLSSVVSEVPATHSAGGALLTPSQDRPKHNKVITNGAAKHPTLKRVSFGSSKGSMVETLIYESPLQEEPEPNQSSDQASVDTNQSSDSGKASKVRVTFFECEKPLVVSSPEPAEQADSLDAPFTMTSSPAPTDNPAYNRQASTDSGWDNPFRPDGDLSREADEIVELIKGGKPITPTPVGGGGSLPEEAPKKAAEGEAKEAAAAKTEAAKEAAGAPVAAAKGTNGTGPPPVSNGDTPAQVEPTRGTLASPAEVERVTLKKKPKCKCCVVQ